jgi:CO dehydrogenase/acetyl-CoA synthase alpha subunit
VSIAIPVAFNFFQFEVLFRFHIRNLELSIGKVVDDSWAEPMEPTPMPDLTTLRDWDMKLLNKHKPFYMPDCDLCCLCTFRKCDLTAGKRGELRENYRSFGKTVRVLNVGQTSSTIPVHLLPFQIAP